ncbi:MAG: flagellar protein FliS [Clostridium sp.]|nr:flagellar protein FliS [Acetatifactor muris]MCM1527787.1 flagellar protein FliS [Bacteroides sp.]MCM1563882.1 flagellar protein FliS [Clostridium sp.]
MVVGMTGECKQQFTLRITQANPTELVVILYEMMFCYLDEAEEATAAKDSAALAEAIRKARGCLNELEQSLHMEYEPAGRLRQLYLYCARKLVHAQAGQENALSEIRRIIGPLHDAYEQIAPQNPKGPVMDNSQTVYAGLTYGRNTLTENMADQGANRGMRV